MTDRKTAETSSLDVPVPPADEAAVLAPHHARADRVFGIALGVHFLIGLALAPFYGTWQMAAGVGALAVGMFALARRLYPGSFASRATFGVAVQTFVILHIYQLHGLPEMHFFFFTACAVMVAGYDRAAMWPGAALIIGQHALFAVLTNSGVQVYFFLDPYVGFWKLFFHFGIAVVHVALCGAWAAHLRRQALWEDGVRRRELAAAAERAQLRQAALARQRRDGLGAMAEGVAHEFNNTLAVVQGYLELAAEAGRPEVGELLAPARAAVDKAAGLCRDLQRFTATAPPAAAPVRLDRFAAESAPLARCALPPHARLLFALDPAAPPALADPHELREALVHLLTNAGEAVAGSGGAVTVRTGAGRPGWVWLEVEDDGVGMTDEVRDRAFDPFFSTKFVGRGLGLAAVDAIATRHGGRVKAWGRPAAGSRFRLTLPAAGAAVGVAVTGEPPARSLDARAAAV